MKVLLLPSGQNQYRTPTIQEVHLQPDILRQFQPGYHQDEAGEEEQTYGGEGEQENDVNFMDPYENTNSYYYHVLSPPENDHTNPTVGQVPTRTIQKFTFLNNGKQCILSIDSGSEGDCMSEAEAVRLKLKIMPLDITDRIPN